MPPRKYAVLQVADGFTLTELLITMAISGILLAAIVSTFITQQKAYALHTQLADMRLNTRAALDMVVREVRMAGYGVPSPLTDTWIDWVQDADGDRAIRRQSGRRPAGGRNRRQDVRRSTTTAKLAHRLTTRDNPSEEDDHG